MIEQKSLRQLVEELVAPIEGAETRYLATHGCWNIALPEQGEVSAYLCEERHMLLLRCLIEVDFDLEHATDTYGKILRCNRLWAENGHITLGLLDGQLLLSREVAIENLSSERFETIVSDMLAKSQHWRLALLDGHLSQHERTAGELHPPDALRV